MGDSIIEGLTKAGYEGILDERPRLVLAPGNLLDANKQFAALRVFGKLGIKVDVRLHGKELVVDLIPEKDPDATAETSEAEDDK